VPPRRRTVLRSSCGDCPCPAKARMNLSSTRLCTVSTSVASLNIGMVGAESLAPASGRRNRANDATLHTDWRDQGSQGIAPDANSTTFVMQTTALAQAHVCWTDCTMCERILVALQTALPIGRLWVLAATVCMDEFGLGMPRKQDKSVCSMSLGQRSP
jgi:hypothetical protein